MACGARVVPKRFSTASSIISRTSEPDIPALTSALPARLARGKTKLLLKGPVKCGGLGKGAFKGNEHHGSGAFIPSDTTRL